MSPVSPVDSEVLKWLLTPSTSFNWHLLPVGLMVQSWINSEAANLPLPLPHSFVPPTYEERPNVSLIKDAWNNTSSDWSRSVLNYLLLAPKEGFVNSNPKVLRET